MSGTSSVELTTLMPCLNEAETIEVCVRKAKAYLEKSGVEGEVLIADNGSTDGSQGLAEALGARVVPVAEKGYGAALQGGIKAAYGKYIIMGDADDSYDFSALQPFVDQLRGGADLVMGNRFKGGVRPGAMPFLHKYLGNPVLSFVGRLFFDIPVGDFHCGLRGFRADRIRELGLRTTGMEFASEMVVRSSLAGFDIREVPTTLDPDGRTRPPHLKTWRDGWRHLKFLLMYSPRWLFFVPGAVCLAVGLFLAAWLIGGDVALGGVVFSQNSFAVACFLTIVGSQLVSVAVIAQQYATLTGFRPHTERTRWLERTVTTDRLVVFAAIVLAAGIAVFSSALAVWAGSSFGDITNPLVPRVVVAGFTIIVVGIQMLVAAFLVGILRIPHS